MSSDDVKAAAEPTDTAAPVSGASTAQKAAEAPSAAGSAATSEAPEAAGATAALGLVEDAAAPEAAETAKEAAEAGKAAEDAATSETPEDAEDTEDTEGGAATAEPSAAPAGTVGPADGGPVKRPRQRRMRDMALSLAVLLVPLGVFLWAWNWVAEDRQVSVVDPTEDYMAAEGLGVEVVRPALSEEWKPISSVLAADEEAVTLRTGWYSPDGFGLQLVQTTGPVDDVDDELTGRSEPVEAAGLEWNAYDTTEGEAWVTELDTSTLVLTAEQDAIGELPELAEGVATALPE